MALGVVAAVVWTVLALSGLLQQRIGMLGQAIVSRFMGLMLVAIGTQLVLGSIADFFGLTSTVPDH